MDQITPSLFDPNYIMRRARAMKLKEELNKTFTQFNSPNLRSYYVLDLGGGKSPYKKLLNYNNVKFITIDIKNYTKNIVVGDAHSLPFKNNLFDIVLGTQVFELFKNPFVAAQEILRVMKLGGKAILTNPACYPPFGEPYWRIAPNGWLLLLKDFSNIVIDAECNTVASFFRTMNVYLDIIFQNTFFKNSLQGDCMSFIKLNWKICKQSL